jgi:hypothetical protein
MDQPHYLRFVHAITFAAIAGGCGARTGSEERYGLDAATSGDSDAVDSSATDAIATPDVPIGSIGACRNFGVSAVTCAPGGTCVLPIGSVGPECRSGIAGANPCGIISCRDGCTCSATPPNASECARATEGPLPPPDLPLA